jgi:hypothetical protein
MVNLPDGRIAEEHLPLCLTVLQIDTLFRVCNR